MMDYNCSKPLSYGKEFCTNLSKFNALGNNMVKSMINSHQTNGLDLLNGLNGQQLSPGQNHHLAHDLNHANTSINQNLLLPNHVANGLHHGDLHADHHLNAGGSIALNSSANGGQLNGGGSNSGNCANSSSTNSSNSSSSVSNKQKRHRTRFTPNQLQQLEVNLCEFKLFHV